MRRLCRSLLHLWVSSAGTGLPAITRSVDCLVKAAKTTSSAGPAVHKGHGWGTENRVKRSFFLSSHLRKVIRVGDWTMYADGTKDAFVARDAARSFLLVTAAAFSSTVAGGKQPRFLANLLQYDFRNSL
jgi:hypothetical protein